MIGLARIAAAVVAAATPPVQQSCGDGWMGVNLVATPQVKHALRAAYIAANPHATVGDPAPGRTYYGSYSGTLYAVATFGAYPTIFRADGRGVWHVRRQTHGGVCTDVVPSELIKAWWLRRYDDRCYVEPF